MLRTAYLCTGNTCSEQIVYRKHILRTDHLQETYILRTDNLQETHAQNRSSTGNTCSEQIIYRKHMLRTDHLQETYMLRTDHLWETHGQGRIIYCTDHQQEKNDQNKPLNVPKTQIIYRENIIRTDHLEKTHDKDGASTIYIQIIEKKNMIKTYLLHKYLLINDQQFLYEKCMPRTGILQETHKNRSSSVLNRRRQEKYDQDKSSYERAR
jgi:hypothetical protein